METTIFSSKIQMACVRKYVGKHVLKKYKDVLNINLLKIVWNTSWLDSNLYPKRIEKFDFGYDVVP